MLRALVLAFSAAGLLAGPAAAEVDIALEAKKRLATKDAIGRLSVKLVDPGVATPGDEIVYTVRLANKGAAPAEQLRFVTPIPRELSYWAGSAAGDGAESAFSVDGGRSFARPEQLFVTEPTGEKRLAKPWEYTHIQWRLSGALPPAAVRTVSFHATVR